MAGDRPSCPLGPPERGVFCGGEVFVVWRNYVQWSAERGRTPPPGVGIGAIPRRLSVREVLRERRFPWKADLRGWLADCDFGRIRTRRLAGRDRVHDLAYAA